ncbi:DUF2076 domain-containing protein [Dyella sp. 20L07]|uniref:DUF2076 domain-containing protein n=1 Tax=Dyella sp. 20L07 TaxID=3384240 RepID=UPI003D2775E5
MSRRKVTLPALHDRQNDDHIERNRSSIGDPHVMTPQEQQLLDDFLQRLIGAGGVSKDPQADALIHQRLAGQPDALYLLVQRSLLQQQALEGAKAQIAQLQAQLSAQQGGGSFLGGQQQPAWGAAPPPYPPQAQAQPAAASGWRERLFGGAPAPQPSAPSFLSQAATTAAGVAGGMFLFDGIENLLGGHHGGGFFGGGQSTVIENVTENNYYDDDRSRHDNDRDFASSDNFASSDDDDLGGSGFDDSSWS